MGVSVLLPPHPGTSAEVLTSYTHQLQSCKHSLRGAQSRRKSSLLQALFCVLVFAALLLHAMLHPDLLLIAVAVPACGLFIFARRYVRSGNEWKALETLHSSLESGIRRLTNSWHGSGNAGTSYRQPNHPYQDDLNILGRGSLFELLCTTRTSAGAQRLATYLLQPVPIAESLFRQQAVIELRDQHALRAQLDNLGRYSFEDCDLPPLHAWLQSPPVPTAPWLSLALFFGTACSLLLGLAVWAQALPWRAWLPCIAILGFIQLLLCAIRFKATRQALQTLRPLTGSFALLQSGLDLLERHDFQCSKLKTIRDSLRQQNASRQLTKLALLFRFIEQREKTEFFLVAALLAVGTQTVLALEHWRAQFGANLAEWVDAWAELDALHALARYAYEHPESSFPQFMEGDSHYHAVQLCHPLLAQQHSVGNEVALGAHSRAYIISGSNMAGKSTLLRTVGLNAVLAYAGAPACAASLHLSALRLFTSIAVNDSLLEGRSRFLAEVESLRDAIAAVRAKQPILFLIDEILSGTNSHDRKAASALILKALLAGNSIGAVSTHDESVAAIARDPAQPVKRMHMTNTHRDDPLSFDYLLRPGLLTESNALAIIRLMGLTQNDDAN